MTRIRNVQGKITETTGGNDTSYAQESIVLNSHKAISIKGEEKGVSFGKPKTFKNDNENFDISLSLNKKNKSLVPLGVLDFENQFENSLFNFDYTLRLTNLDSLNFEVFDQDGNVIYQMNNLAPVVVTAQKLPLLFNKLKEETPLLDPLKPIKTFDIQKIIDEFLYPDLTHTGSYSILWDGFDNNNVYDSTRFNGKKLKAKITAKKGGTTKSLEVEFETKYNEVNWVDVKIDKNKKRIDVTLRVDLKDGGAEGLGCSTHTELDTTIEGDPNPFKGISVTTCDWDKIPKNDIVRIGKPVIKTRIKSFNDLEKLAIDGLKYHWGRNSNHVVAKNVSIQGEIYEVFVEPINTTENAMDDVSLVFNTNNKWMRSGNPGSATLNPISWIGNLVSREAVCYNVGYIKGDKWSYREINNEEIDFSETSAHEIGHEILKSYGGTNYSYGHKGTVNVVTQSSNSNSGKNPTSGEIDLMPYYTDWLDYSQKNRIAASEKDVLSLIWLTKIIIK